MGLLAGIGFTMFISLLAFDAPGFQMTVKLSVMIASVCPGVAGYLFLRFCGKNPSVQQAH